MNKKIMVRVLFGFVSFIILLVIISHAANKTQTPKIIITEPANNFSIQAKEIAIKGKVEPFTAAVLVANHRIKVNSDGSFSDMVNLPNEGVNNISVVANNHNNKATSFIAVNRIFTPAEKADQLKAQAEANAKAQADKATNDAKTQELFSRITKRYDDIEKSTYYYSKSFPADYHESAVMLYAVKPDNGYPVLYLKVQYYGSDWLFIEKYIFNIDGTNFNLVPNKVEKDNSDKVWEWSVMPVGADLQSLIQSITTSKQAKLRYIGQQYYKDRIISASEKSAITDVLNVFNTLQKQR